MRKDLLGAEQDVKASDSMYVRRMSEARSSMTKAEQETIIRWDQDERVVRLYTAYPREARKWARLGYQVEVDGRTQAGQPRSWRAQAPLAALRLRRLVNEQLVFRRRGRSLGAGGRKLAAPEHGSRRQGAGPRFSRVRRSDPANEIKLAEG